ncbi:hypothetical protein AGMMS50233_05730 [Endomicrobiia bacterium]|nr:hypothetical protein AGMMS50233_05730 [Endomicrobiia bacterium]
MGPWPKLQKLQTNAERGNAQTQYDFFWEGGVIYLDGKEGVASQDLNAAMYYFILIDASHNNKKVLDFKVN